jgi:thiol-disulfide isomerase/thioredoxin
MKQLFVFIALITVFTLTAQDSIVIKGHFKKNSRFTQVVMKKFAIGEFAIGAFPIDKETGDFTIIAPSTIQPGIYRLQYSQISESDYVDVIINGQEKIIEFTLDVLNEHPNRLPMFTVSNENKSWISFVKKHNLIKSHIQPLAQFLASYPSDNDKIFKSVYKEFTTRFKELQGYKSNYVSSSPFYWTKQMALFETDYFTNPREHIRIQQFNYHQNFWDTKPTSDPLLINSPLYSQAILNYLQYYMNPDFGFSQEETIEGLKKSVDLIVRLFSNNHETKEFVIKYLQLGFKEIGQEEVLQYIDENYKNFIEQCQNDQDKSAFEKRIQGYQAMKPGSLAPEVKFIKDNKELGLHDLNSKYVIVAFWASWCPNCEEQMPLLQDYLAKVDNLSVVAVSLDHDQTDYNGAIQKYPNMYHVNDFKKWDGDYVNSYFIYGSPTFILLDAHRKIIGKYTTVSDIINTLSSLK